jgi:myo-inositol-1(or 4)-monophosphatase
MQHSLLADVARRAVLAVRDPLAAAFRSGVAVDFKRDRHDPVTEHDRRAEATIRDLIVRAVPDSTIVGEEGGTVGTGAVHWYVDPIDGTANFARGLAFWCTSVAAVADGRIVAGAILDPIAGQLFVADTTGASLNGRPLAARAAQPDETAAVLITGYPVPRDFRLDGEAAALDRFGLLTRTFATVRRPGSAALSIAHVAAGWVDAAAGFGVNAWDVAAAILILEQAGGRYRPYDLGAVAPSAPAWLHPGYVATGPGADYPTLDRVARDICDARRPHAA